MILCAIWNEQAQVNFSEANKIAPACRVSAIIIIIWGLWKIYECLFIPKRQKISWKTFVKMWTGDCHLSSEDLVLTLGMKLNNFAAVQMLIQAKDDVFWPQCKHKCNLYTHTFFLEQGHHHLEVYFEKQTMQSQSQLFIMQ